MILLQQIQSLQKSIEKYLQNDSLPTLKVSIVESVYEQKNSGIKEAKHNISDIVDRLKRL